MIIYQENLAHTIPLLYFQHFNNNYITKLLPHLFQIKQWTLRKVKIVQKLDRLVHYLWPKVVKVYSTKSLCLIAVQNKGKSIIVVNLIVLIENLIKNNTNILFHNYQSVMKFSWIILISMQNKRIKIPLRIALLHLRMQPQQPQQVVGVL